MSHPRDLNSVIDLGATLVSSYQHPGYGNSLQWYVHIMTHHNTSQHITASRVTLHHKRSQVILHHKRDEARGKRR